MHAALWAEFDAGYFQRFDAQEIAWHTRMLAGQPQPGKPVVKARLSPGGEGVQVLIYSVDKPRLFVRICRFFERTSFDIVDAKIYTTAHGNALDMFQVLEQGQHQLHYRDMLNFIEFELAALIDTEDTQLDPPLRGRIPRQLKHFPIEPTVLLEPDERGQFWRLTLTAGDRPGLLSGIARLLVRHDVSVRSAKITTLGARAEDVFQVAGSGLSSVHQREELRADLSACLRPV